MNTFIKKPSFSWQCFFAVCCCWFSISVQAASSIEFGQHTVNLQASKNITATSQNISSVNSSMFVFVDTSMDNYPMLVRDIQAQNFTQNIRIVYINPNDDGVQKITETLADYAGVKTIHVLSHGGAGLVRLGNTELNQHTINHYSKQLSAWKNALAENADILFYGCNVTASAAGFQLIKQIGDLTQAHIAASNNLTGAVSLGGDWNLESHYGKINSKVIVSAQAQQNWYSTLAGYTDYIYILPGSDHSQTFTSSSVAGESFTFTPGGSTSGSTTFNKIAVQLKDTGGAASQTIKVCFRYTFGSSSGEKCDTKSSTLLTTDFQWYVFDTGNYSINHNVLYYVYVSTSGTDGKVAINYSTSSKWNNSTTFYYSNTSNSSWDMYVVLSSGSNSTPTVSNAISDQTANVGVAFSYTFNSNTFDDDDDRDTLTYTATLSDNSVLPTWLTFNPATRNFSGTPAGGDAGEINVKVTANDGNGGTVSNTFKITTIGTLSYYGISLSSPGVTCAGSAITISAYNASDALVAPANGTVITLSTSPATGTWVGGNTATFDGVVKSVTKYLQQTTASTLNINVTDGTYSEKVSLDPDITFAASALNFYGSTGLGAMPNQVAGTADANPILKAGNCTAQVTGAKNVRFGYECRNPTTCVGGQTLNVNGNSIQSNANGASITYSAVQSLTFDGSGIASIPIAYSDVGKVKIYATMTLAASGNNPAITLTANSGDFIVKPHTLVASAIQTSGAVANPGGSSVSGTAADFVAAGDAFTLKVEARNSAGNRTPNFGNETSTENNITFVPQALIYPAGGTLTALSNAAAFTATTPAGTFINSTIAWQQVGSFTARPELGDNDYQGAGDLVSKTTTGTIGRFYPDHFSLASSSTSNSCAVGGFSFLSQPAIGLNYVLQAKSSTNATVTNYGTNYGATQATVSYVAENANSGDGATYTSRLSTGAAATWVSGVMTFTNSTTSVLRQLTTFAADGPFASLQWGLSLTESFDGGRSLSGKNMNALTTGVCAGAGCTAISLGSALNLRYGRLRLDSASGPETAALPVNFLSEYWVGNRFVLNSNDSCTVVPLSAITYPSGTLATPANFTVALSAGTTTGVYSNTTGGVNFSAGSAGHYFSKPSAGGTGSFVVSIDLSTLTWLRYDWNQDGTSSDTSIPNVKYNFGFFRGHDRIIYWHEKM